MLQKENKALLFWCTKVVFLSMRYGLLPLGLRTLKTIKKEGSQDLHWKILGDSLVNIFHHSGPVLTKLGQVLATRHDLLPKPICERLEILFNSIPPMTNRELKSILNKNFKNKKPFMEFNYVPIGVGSIGQAHYAKLKNGQSVIVKVLRPGVIQLIDRDLRALKAFSKLIIPPRRKNQFYFQMIDQLGDSMRNEIDLKKEAKSLIYFKKSLKKNKKVYVPECFFHLCTREVLVMEEIKGVPISTLKNTNDLKIRKQIAQLALEEILRQIFEVGYFHADPHGGNLLLMENGLLGIIDLGLTGKFEKKERRILAHAVKALIKKDSDQLVKSLLEFGILPKKFDLSNFKKDIKNAVQEKKGELVGHLKGESQIPLDHFINELFQIAFNHGIHVPSSTVLLIKTLVTIEGVARSLDPELNVVKIAAPVVVKSIALSWLKFWKQN